jgi:integrase
MGNRARRQRGHISKRAKWYSGALTEQILGVVVGENRIVDEEEKGMQEFIELAWTNSTLDHYGAEWERFVAWCAMKKLESLPAKSDTVARYLVWRFNNSAESVKGTVSAAITNIHKASGYESPIESALVEWVKRGIEKCRTRREKTKPFPLEYLRKWRVLGWKELGISEERWLRESALIALGIRAIQRPDDLSRLNIGDIIFGEKEMWVTIKSSKADQEGKGHVIPIDATENEDMCVVGIMAEYLKYREGEKGQPMFLTLKEDKRLSPGAISSAVKFVVEKVGSGEKGISGRSLRVGGATIGVAAGVSAEILKTIAGWKSDAIWEYVRAEGAKSGKISERMGFG